jgi:uncharacterized metal-binding protein
MRSHQEATTVDKRHVPYKLLIFTCYGGCATGVAASRACIRFWEEHPDDVKIGCLPAVIVPWKRKEITENSERRLLIDACGVRCGAALTQREGLTIDRYVELTSLMHVTKQKRLPSTELEEEIYRIISREASLMLQEVDSRPPTSTTERTENSS